RQSTAERDAAKKNVRSAGLMTQPSTSGNAAGMSAIFNDAVQEFCVLRASGVAAVCSETHSRENGQPRRDPDLNADALLQLLLVDRIECLITRRGFEGNNGLARIDWRRGHGKQERPLLSRSRYGEERPESGDCEGSRSPHGWRTHHSLAWRGMSWCRDVVTDP